MVKVVTLALALGIVLYVFFYLPQRLKRGPGARFRYVVFSAIAILFTFVLLRFFL